MTQKRKYKFIKRINSVIPDINDGLSILPEFKENVKSISNEVVKNQFNKRLFSIADIDEYKKILNLRNSPEISQKFKLNLNFIIYDYNNEIFRIRAKMDNLPLTNIAIGKKILGIENIKNEKYKIITETCKLIYNDVKNKIEEYQINV